MNKYNNLESIPIGDDYILPINGQLYVVCSRIRKPNNLFIYIYAPNEITKNIVYYPKALQ